MLSCLLEINDDLYALAPAHIFNIEHEDEDKGESSGNQTTLRKETRSSAANTNIPHLKHLEVVVPGPNDIPEDETDADWAATRIKLPTHYLTNMYWDGTADPRYIESVAIESMVLDAWSTGPLQVHILTSSASSSPSPSSSSSSSPVKRGRLLQEWQTSSDPVGARPATY